MKHERARLPVSLVVTDLAEHDRRVPSVAVIEPPRDGTGGLGSRVKGIVLAAGPGRRLHPLTDALPKTLLPLVDGRHDPRPRARATSRSVGIRDVVVVTGFAAARVEERAADLRAAARRSPRARLQRAGRGMEQRVLALARARGARGRRAARERRHRAPQKRRGGPPGRAAAPDRAPGRSTGRSSLGDEEMKVLLADDGTLQRISKQIDPVGRSRRVHRRRADRGRRGGAAGATRSRATWRRDPSLYYEDGFQELADRGGSVHAAAIGTVDWVEVDDHADLARARELDCRVLARMVAAPAHGRRRAAGAIPALGGSSSATGGSPRTATSPSSSARARARRSWASSARVLENADVHEVEGGTAPGRPRPRRPRSRRGSLRRRRRDRRRPHARRRQVRRRPHRPADGLRGDEPRPRRHRLACRLPRARRTQGLVRGPRPARGRRRPRLRAALPAASSCARAWATRSAT